MFYYQFHYQIRAKSAIITMLPLILILLLS